MDNTKLQTPKGFRDFLPPDAIRRAAVVEKIAAVFKKFGFDPLETPTLEYADTLKGKYGEEEKLIYEFKTKGGDEVALKYDLTVPLARVVSQYGPTGTRTLPIPFKRYQIQSAFRGENTQKGRYREFLQCDCDIVGVSTPLADAELLALVYEVYKTLNLEVNIKVNDRLGFNEFVKLGVLEESQLPEFLRSLDKMDKLGKEGVLDELAKKGIGSEKATFLLQKIDEMKPTKNLAEAFDLLGRMGYEKNIFKFSPTLARGLDYYTGMIIEVVLKSEPTSSSLGGGGRYDKLIGKFSGNDLPAVGFSVGLDRTVEAIEKTEVLNVPPTQTKVLVTVFSPDLINKSLEVSSLLRSNQIFTEIWLDPETKLDKQLKYADFKGIPYAVIVGPDEAVANQVTLKNLVNKTQKILPIDRLLSALINLISNQSK